MHFSSTATSLLRDSDPLIKCAKFIAYWKLVTMMLLETPLIYGDRPVSGKWDPCKTFFLALRCEGMWFRENVLFQSKCMEKPLSNKESAAQNMKLKNNSALSFSLPPWNDNLHTFWGRPKCRDIKLFTSDVEIHPSPTLGDTHRHSESLEFARWKYPLFFGCKLGSHRLCLNSRFRCISWIESSCKHFC